LEASLATLREEALTAARAAILLGDWSDATCHRGGSGAMAAAYTHSPGERAWSRGRLEAASSVPAYHPDPRGMMRESGPRALSDGWRGGGGFGAR